MFETKSRTPRGGPVQALEAPARRRAGSIGDPGVSRPDGGRANGVSFSRIAKTKASSRPSTKTGIETPRLATTMVPTSMAELRRYGRDDAER